MPSLQQYKSAYDAAVQAGDVASANEIADHINAMAEQLPEQAPKEARPEFQTPTATSGGNYMVSGYMAAPEEQARAKEVGLKYIVPAAAAVASGGLSLGAQAAISGLTGISGDIAAQFLKKEREPGYEFSPREAAATGIVSAAIPVPLKPVAGEVVTAGKAVLNYLTNVGLIGGAGEAARFIETGEFKKPEGKLEIATRVVAPVVLPGISTLLGYKAARAQERLNVAEEIFKERGAQATLAEIVPEKAALEIKQVQKNNPIAVEAYNNIDAGIAPRIQEAIANAPNQAEIAQQMMPQVVNLESMRSKAASASRAASEAADRASQAAAASAKEYVTLSDEAEKAATQTVKEKVLVFQNVEKMMGSSVNDISEVATGARIQRMQDLYKAAKSSVKEGLGSLYGKAGIKPEDAVVPSEAATMSIVRSIDNLPDRAEVIKQVDTVLKSLPGMLDDGGNITLAAYRRITQDLAEGLVKSGKDPKAANRLAAQAYGAIKSAADEYLSAARPEAIGAFRKANEANAAISKARSSESKAIQMIADGDVAGLVGIIEKEGYGPVANTIKGYSAALSGIGDEASKGAAKQFIEDIHLAIRDHLLESSMKAGQGIDEASKIMDVPALIKRLDTLRQKGISPASIGFGSDEGVKAMARVAAAKNGSMSAEELSRFLDDAGRLGAGAAEARQLYDESYRKFLTAKGVPERRAELEKLNKLSKKTQFTAAEQNDALRRAENDPLVRLFNEPGLGLAPSLTANAQYVNRVLDAGPDAVKRLVNTLQENVGGETAQALGRVNTLEQLRKSAVAQVFGETLKKAMGPDRQKADLTRITDFFYSPTNKARRDAFIELVGRDAYRNLENLIGKPASKIIDRFEKAKIALPDTRAEFTVAAGTLGQLQGRPTGGVVIGNYLDRMLNFIQNKQYNLLYALYVNPETAKAWAKSLSDVNKFVNANPRNAAIYRIAQDADNSESTERQPTR